MGIIKICKKYREFEDNLAEKLMSFAGVILAKMIVPDMKFNNILEIDEHRIKDFKENYGIEGIILDVDQTILNKTIKIPKCNMQWIDLIRKNFKVIVLSNGWNSEVQKYFESIGIDYIYLAMKPAKHGFRKACKKLGVRPDHILVIGDSLFDDIYGAKRNNMMNAQIKDVREDEDIEI